MFKKALGIPSALPQAVIRGSVQVWEGPVQNQFAKLSEAICLFVFLLSLMDTLAEQKKQDLT
jgi:hypothetical protein